MKDIVVAIDVGATNTRARVAEVTGAGQSPLVLSDFETQVGSATELGAVVSRVASGAALLGKVASAVVAVAGPVAEGGSSVTNWHVDAAVTVGRLERAGLPAGRTSLVNDVVAGAWGALARIQSPGSDQFVELLTDPAVGGPSLGGGTVVYIAPGTGLGAACLIRHGMGALGASAVGCEAQHTTASRFEGDMARAADAVADSLGRAPSWEDMVSGRGLGRIYSALRASAAAETPGPDDDAKGARAIAELALAGTDPVAVEAVFIYYRTLGYFAQMLALAYLPCAAVVIGGASTEHNITLLRSSGLAGAFTDNDRLSGLLSRIPLYVVGGEVNLEGGLWLATRDERP